MQHSPKFEQENIEVIARTPPLLRTPFANRMR